MIRQLGGFLQRVCKHGHKFAPDHNGKFTIVTGSWGKKYLINEKLFYQLWHDDDMKCYFALETLGDKKLAKLIARHFKKVSAEQLDASTISTTTQEEKKMEYPVYAANVPDEDDGIQETTQPQPTEQPKTTQLQQQPQPTVQAVPDYTTAMSQITKELHAIRDAKTRDELLSAKSRCEKLIEIYTPYYDYQCNQKRLDVEYYVEAFDKRATA